MRIAQTVTKFSSNYDHTIKEYCTLEGKPLAVAVINNNTQFTTRGEECYQAVATSHINKKYAIFRKRTMKDLEICICHWLDNL
jgi:hypothetical protein